jgi:hypothetical protein
VRLTLCGSLAHLPDPNYVHQVKAIVAALIGAAVLAAGTQSLASAPPPHAAQTPQYEVPLAYLTPIPIVRVAGRIRRTGVRITMLSVTSPRGSTVTVRCSGGRKRGCRFKSKTKHSPKSKKLRFRELEHSVRSGVKIAVFVRKGNTIGKYTRFTIRKRRSPSRSDRCLFPGDPFEPQACP